MSLESILNSLFFQVTEPGKTMPRKHKTAKSTLNIRKQYQQ